MKIFITGVSSGIGKALAAELVNNGHEVWGVARRNDLLVNLSKSLGEKNIHVSFCDIASTKSVLSVLEEMKREGFIPDALVLNAAINEEDAGKIFNLNVFQNSFKVNLDGALIWVKHFLPIYLKHKRGIIISISSTASLRPGLKSISYSASKSALSNTFRGLRLNYGHQGVRFITVLFGPIRTGMWRGPNWLPVPSSEKAAKFIARMLHKKSGTYYYPVVYTSIARIIWKLPDSITAKIYNRTKLFLRKVQ